MILSIILLTVTLSIDALFAGFSYGLNKTRIPWASKLIICAFSVIYAALALLVGSALANILPPLAGKLVGAAVLAALGLSMILKSLSCQEKKTFEKNNDDSGDDTGPRTLCKIIIKSFGITIEILKNNPAAGDIDRSGIIDKKEALLLGFALSVDSLGAGIGSAMSGLCGWYIPFIVGLCQLAFLSTGLFAGAALFKRNEGLFAKYDMVTKILPGVLLVCLSVLRLL